MNKPTRFGREVYKGEAYAHVEGFQRNHKFVYGQEPPASDVADMLAHSIGVALLAALTDIECDGMEPDLSSIEISLSPERDGVHDVYARVDAYPIVNDGLENDCE